MLILTDEHLVILERLIMDGPMFDDKIQSKDIWDELRSAGLVLTVGVQNGNNWNAISSKGILAIKSHYSVDSKENLKETLAAKVDTN